MTKRLLDKKNVSYEVIDVDDNPEALETIRALGHNSLPVIITDSGENFSGFQPERLSALAA
jgi:glutaredoxin-like protein NrdH